MSRKELIRRQQAMTRSSNRGGVVWLVLFFGILLANLKLAKLIDCETTPIWAQVLYGVALFGFLLGNIPLVVWYARRQQRRFGVLCPFCGKPMIGITGQIAVATGACGLCGERVLSEDGTVESEAS